MLEVTVEGIYESDIGSGQKKFQNFNYKFEVTREKVEGINTHVLRRFIPYLIREDKKKNGIPFSRVKNFTIIDTQKNNKKSELVGKKIFELTDYEIQDLACLFDLYEIPLSGECSIHEMREKATNAYLKTVLNVPMDTAQEKRELDFFKQLPDGTFKFDASHVDLTVSIPVGYFDKKEENKKEKKSLSYFLQKAGQTVASAVSTLTGNEAPKNPATSQPNEGEPKQGAFPSMDDLTD